MYFYIGGGLFINAGIAQAVSTWEGSCMTSAFILFVFWEMMAAQTRYKSEKLQIQSQPDYRLYVILGVGTFYHKFLLYEYLWIYVYFLRLNFRTG